ncbi:unnamed protein product [Ceratitis capitata]|uniref:(Mediterranean fruit fly) hypothetical protein n=1 Tax=Ceratitis capitata TaxID=7213 RepID=A0A811V933_CERCA|nr:unnamed protein product [Ceratitis capitata]
MLSTSRNNNPTPPATTIGGSMPLQANNTSSPTSSLQNLKGEHFSTLSPLNGWNYDTTCISRTSPLNRLRYYR